jgi:hypothetical protein
MRQQTGSRNRGWLPTIGNRLSVAAGVALAAGMMAGTAWGAPGLLATGGDVTNVIGPIGGKYYGVHQFTNTVGTAYFTPLTAPLTVEYLVIGGGGGGGSDDSNWQEGGGGGGGGFVTGTISLASGPYSVTVGGGGAGSTQYSDLNGANGSNSVFNGVTAYGGGGGGSGYAPSQAGNNGGCGGGGYGEGVHAGGTGTQGYNGGSGVGSAGGGGGGAGSQGADGSSNTGGNGGAGKASSISGVTTNYAGGGGAGGYSGRGKGTDGGGNGGITTGGSGTDGLGGGGGGGNSGGKGGSGIVIVRYEISPPSVNLTAPTNNQVFAWNYASIAATATVANATVTSVDFYTNTASAAYGLAGSDSDPTGGYTLSLASGSLPAGTNHIYAVMTATEGTFTSTTNAFIVKAAPSVYVTVPTSGQQYTAIDAALGIGVTAVVSNGVGPFTVEFFTNAVTQSSASAGTDSVAPYTRTLGALAASTSYEIYAVVTDTGNGNETATSVTNGFQVLSPDLAVIVSGPTEYPYNGMIACTATVAEASGGYTVQFYTNSVASGNEVGAPGSTTPYGISFGPLAPGSYSIYAKVTDTIKSVTSAVHTVTVLAAPTVTLNTPTPGQQFALNASVTGTVTCTPGKAPYSVTFYTNKNGSAYGPAGTDVGTGTRTSFTNVLSSLGTGTYGIYAVVSDGYGSQATSGTNIVLVGGTLPTLSHRPPTLVTTGSATFNGFLSTTGNPSTYVYVLYGQNPSAWSFTNAVTEPVSGWTNNSPIAASIGSLTPGLTYYYTIGASNGAPFNATTTASGTTNFITGEVTVQATDASAQHPGNNGQFTIYRPATCTNAALVVSYTLSGATVSPSGSATLNAGSTSAVVTVAPSVIVGYSSNAVLTLTAGAGNYPFGTPANSATCTVLATDVTPTAPFWAWGGDSNFTTTVSGRLYAVHMYTNVGSGYFVPSKPIQNVEYLVVGGGGGGGSYDSGYAGGGGGAGGLITSVADGHSGGGTANVGSAPNSPTNLTASTPYPVTVGAGGGAGVKGGDSSFGSFATASGGGYGGGRFLVGSSGGSGGGGAYGGVGGVGTTGQGWAGGSNLSDKGGGGGGAGNVGQNATSSTAGDGGPGLTNSITGSDVAYAGGGGGQLPTTGTGGSGVGGNGNSLGTNGRGGGGGGFAAGGSGIVIVRYDITPPKGTMILLR